MTKVESKQVAETAEVRVRPVVVKASKGRKAKGLAPRSLVGGLTPTPLA